MKHDVTRSRIEDEELRLRIERAAEDVVRFMNREYVLAPISAEDRALRGRCPGRNPSRKIG